jgi:hypothetical protein
MPLAVPLQTDVNSDMDFNFRIRMYFKYISYAEL